MLWSAMALLLSAALTAGTLLTRAHAPAAYQTTPVVQQDLTQSVTASGTVNPQNTVNVGTQISGTIDAVYVDYNSKVYKGEVLARIDTAQLDAQLAQAQASLAQAQEQAGAQAQNADGAQASVAGAQAGIATAQANVVKSQSALQVADDTLSRDRTLLAQGYIAQSQFDSDQSAQVAAQSALSAAQAALTQARAQNTSTANSAGAAQDTAGAAQAAVAAAQAQVAQDELNLQHSVIVSPVDGTVIARDVSVGQTVAASLQTPTLFEIAQNLHKMEVDISVGEPDIGNVRAGEPVSFSVLAYPNQTFTGTVSQVRVNPTTVNNVVTYDVLTLVNNSKGQLLPGMTANATIAVQIAKNALVVPAAALSFRPAGDTRQGTHRYAGRPSAPGSSAAAASPWGQTAGGASGTAGTGSNGMIFLDRSGKPVPVPVHVNLMSGAQAAVTPLRGTLEAGDSVIVSSGSASSASGSHGTPSHGFGGLGRAL
jgi:HlyD family secretion protein